MNTTEILPAISRADAVTSDLLEQIYDAILQDYEEQQAGNFCRTIARMTNFSVSSLRAEMERFLDAGCRFFEESLWSGGEILDPKVGVKLKAQFFADSNRLAEVPSDELRQGMPLLTCTA